MSETKKSEIHWFMKKYGINFFALDPDVREVVEKLGEEGIDKLVKENKGTIAYRDERISNGDRNSLINQIQRLKDEGGGEWVPGQVNIGDKPSDWVDSEIDYLKDE